MAVFLKSAESVAGLRSEPFGVRKSVATVLPCNGISSSCDQYSHDNTCKHKDYDCGLKSHTSLFFKFSEISRPTNQLVCSSNDSISSSEI